MTDCYNERNCVNYIVESDDDGVAIGFNTWAESSYHVWEQLRRLAYKGPVSRATYFWITDVQNGLKYRLQLEIESETSNAKATALV